MELQLQTRQMVLQAMASNPEATVRRVSAKKRKKLQNDY